MLHLLAQRAATIDVQLVEHARGFGFGDFQAQVVGHLIKEDRRRRALTKLSG